MDRAQSWNVVYLDLVGSLPTVAAASHFLSRVGDALAKANYPDVATVFHGSVSSGGEVYYLSPLASVIAAEVIAEYQGRACPQPDIDSLRMVTF